MDKNLYIAKTIYDANSKTMQYKTIQQHTDDILEQFNILKQMYANRISLLNWDILKLACIYHDLGKMNPLFQNKIMSKCSINSKLPSISDIEIPHGYLSVAFLPREFLKKHFSEDDIRILYQSIYYHHNRVKFKNDLLIKKVVVNDLPVHYDNFIYDKLPEVEKLYPSSAQFYNDRFSMNYIDFDFLDDDEEEQLKLNIVYKYIITKGLLNKLDYAASCGHINVEYKPEKLVKHVVDYIESMGASLNELQEFMIRNSEKNVIVTASTGIGKTEAGLLWIGNTKGFFTLPLKTSINAIYKRIINNIHYPSKSCGLLHSDMISELNAISDNIDLDFIEQTKQLSLPLTICTLDQLIDFVFKYEGFELKLSTLSYSKIIIDEIQMYSGEMIGMLIVALKYITDCGGKFSIMTATFPPLFEYFIQKEIGEESYIKPVKPFVKLNEKGNSIVRHKVTTVDETLTVNDIISKYNKNKVLVIVNTIKQAQLLFKELKDKNISNVNLFHSEFIKQDKTLKELGILNFGNCSCAEHGIWITTQVVEASLDIDFDVLLTELSELSALFQRLGRCHRHRPYSGIESNVFVYCGTKTNLPSGVSKSQSHSIVEYEIFEKSKNLILDFKSMVITEELKIELINTLYSVGNLKNTYYFKTITNTIKALKYIEDYSIHKKEINLRNILNYTVIPVAIYNQNKERISQLVSKLSDSSVSLLEKVQLKNEILNLTTSIPVYKFKKLQKLKKVSDKLSISAKTTIYVVDTIYSFEEGLVTYNLNS